MADEALVASKETVMPSSLLTKPAGLLAGERPLAKQSGELYVNWPDKQIGVFDTTKGALDLGAVRFFSDEALYAVGDHVIEAGVLYRCIKAVVAPGAFVESNWEGTGGSILPYGRKVDLYVSLAGDDTSGDGSEAAPWATLKHAGDYVKGAYSRIDGMVRINVGQGDFPATNAYLYPQEGSGSIYIKGAGSALTSIGAVSVYGNATPGATAKVCFDKLAFRNQGVSVIQAGSGAYVGLGTRDYYDTPSRETDLVIDIQAGGPDWIIIYGRSTLDIAYNGGKIECRQYGRGGWGVINAGQYGGGNTVIDNATWEFTGATPDSWSWAFIFMWDSVYTAAAKCKFIETTPPLGQKFIGLNGSKFYTSGLQGAAPAAPGGLEFFPGSYAGTWDTSCFYDNVLGGSRRVLTANQAYAVDAAGSDRNSGLLGKPWLTLAKAFSVIGKGIDLNGFGVTLTIGAGSFVGADLPDLVGSGSLTIDGAGSALTTITPGPFGWSLGACLGFGSGRAKIYLNHLALQMPAGWNAIYASNTYSLNMRGSDYSADLVFIAPATSTFGPFYLNNTSANMSNTGGGVIELRAGASIGSIWETNGGSVSDDAAYMFTGIPALATFVKAGKHGSVMRSAGAVTGDITGVVKQFSLSSYTSLQINNGAFYPGPAGTLDASCMSNGVMGAPAEFDATEAVDDHETRIAKRQAELGVGPWTPPDEPPFQYPTPEEYEARMAAHAERMAKMAAMADPDEELVTAAAPPPPAPPRANHTVNVPPPRPPPPPSRTPPVPPRRRP